jgi:acetyltransferase
MSSPERPSQSAGRPPDAAATTLKDGRTVRLRAARPSDESEYLDAFERMAPQARYMRFMRAVRRPNVDRLRSVLASLGEGVVGVVATVPASDGYDIVGSAVVVRGPDPAIGEFAVSTLGEWGGSGLGRALMESVIEAARRRGVRELEGFVLAENRAMLRLATKLGFEIVPDPDDASVRICRRRLDPPDEIQRSPA